MLVIGFLREAVMRFCSLCFLLVVGSLMAWVAPVAASTLIYDPATGNVSLDSQGQRIVSMVVDSTSGIFTGQRPPSLNGEFDVFRSKRLFKFDASGFGNVDFGAAAAKGLTEAALLRDLCVAGSLPAGESLSGVRLKSAQGALLKLCDTTPLLDASVPPPASVVALYNPYSGQLELSVKGATLTAVELVSPLDVFTGQRPAQLNGPLDVYSPNKLLKYDPNGFGSIDFGIAMAKSIWYEPLQTIQISGVVQSDGGSDEVPFSIQYIPEPSVATLWICIGLGLLRKTRQRTSS